MTDPVVLQGESYNRRSGQWDGPAVRFVLSEPCETCDGIGVVPGPAWVEFDAALLAARADGNVGPDETHGEHFDAWALAWWNERGFSWGSDGRPSRLPSEDDGCGECDASGSRLTDAGQALARVVLGLFAEALAGQLAASGRPPAG